MQCVFLAAMSGAIVVPAPVLPIEKRTTRGVTAIQHSAMWHDKACDMTMTSAGSSSTVSGGSTEDWDPISPLNWRIRNTFLDAPIVKPTLLQSFQRSRRTWSVPAGGREAADREEVSCQSASMPSPASSDPDPVMQPIVDSTELPPSAPRPLMLAELVSPQPSSKGSVLHYQGTCKPCAFFWKVVGCKYGTECEFCHLCDADERKRRNKEKRMAMHALQTGSRAPCVGGAHRRARG